MNVSTESEAIAKARRWTEQPQGTPDGTPEARIERLVTSMIVQLIALMDADLEALRNLRASITKEGING